MSTLALLCWRYHGQAMVAERDVEVDHVTITARYRGARQRVPAQRRQALQVKSRRPTWNWPATCRFRSQAIDRYSHLIDVHVAARPGRHGPAVLWQAIDAATTTPIAVTNEQAPGYLPPGGPAAGPSVAATARHNHTEADHGRLSAPATETAERPTQCQRDHRRACVGANVRRRP